MQNMLKNTPGGENTAAPWILLLILTGYVIAGMFIFSIIGSGVWMLFGFDLMEMQSVLSNPGGQDHAKVALMIVQGLTSLGAFIIAPLFFIKMNLKLPYGDFLSIPKSFGTPALMTLVLMFCFMIANSALIDWNQSIKFPEALAGFERWAMAKELELEKLTKFLTQFDTVGQYLLALVVIAVFPAIGEELLFRGLIQNLFQTAFKNAHVAIWLSAFLFAVFHIQFYGVVPRMMLGVLFGYLFYWSGSLSLAILAHFINNAFSLTVFYLSQQQIIEMSPEELEKSPPYYIILLFLALGTVLLLLFKKYFSTKTDE